MPLKVLALHRAISLMAPDPHIATQGIHHRERSIRVQCVSTCLVVRQKTLSGSSGSRYPSILEVCQPQAFLGPSYRFDPAGGMPIEHTAVQAMSRGMNE